MMSILIHDFRHEKLQLNWIQQFHYGVQGSVEN